MKIKLALQDDVSFLDYDYEVSISECAVGAEQLVEEEKLQLIAAFQSLYSLVTRIVGYHADRIEVVHYRRNKSRPVNGKREFITLTSSTERPQTPE